MLFHGLHKLTWLPLMSGLLVLGLPAFAAAETTTSENDKTPETMVAALAEDENVEDVERSEPRADANSDAQPEPQPKTTAAQATPTKPASKVAPNIDLKEVAPAPEPTTPAQAPVTETAAQEDSEVRPGEETVTAAPVSTEPQPASRAQAATDTPRMLRRVTAATVARRRARRAASPRHVRVGLPVPSLDH